MQSPKPCPFCQLEPSRLIAGSSLAIVIRDGYPISPGHTLIIPRRHVSSFFEVSAEERRAMFELLDTQKHVLDQEFSPAGYNVGINDGAAAGQTVPHLHIHLIPRYPGDLPDPRGGVRWVLPSKARYWAD